MNPRMLDFYMGVARHCARMSRARRLQVGSILVKDNNIISFSWNGTPSGWDNNCEEVEWCDGGAWLDVEEILEMWPYEGLRRLPDGSEVPNRYRLKTRPEVLHAEANVLSKVARSQYSSEKSTLFVTHAPCMECAKLIYQAGVDTVYFDQYYRSHVGVEFLQKIGIPVIKLEHADDTV